MDHVAIMRKSWGLVPKVLSGEKKIESRWYLNKYKPWGAIKKGDRIFFKDSGFPITVSAKVEKILQFENLNRKKVKEILMQFGREDGIGSEDVPHYFDLFKDKNYCLLIFLEKVKKVKPFNIDKTGFGMMSSWITVKNIKQISKTVLRSAEFGS